MTDKRQNDIKSEHLFEYRLSSYLVHVKINNNRKDI
jgi:hypothetical protein